MAPIIVDPSKVREFSDAESFYLWLSKLGPNIYNTAAACQRSLNVLATVPDLR